MGDGVSGKDEVSFLLWRWRRMIFPQKGLEQKDALLESVGTLAPRGQGEL